MNFPGKQKSSGSKEVDLNPLLPELFVLQGFSVRKNKSAKPFVSTVSHFCGGGEGSRTPVRKSLAKVFSERSQCF